MSEITKYTANDIAEELIRYREERGEKLNKGDAQELVKDVFAVITQVLTADDAGVVLGKVGLVYNGLQKGREGRHPQTNAQIIIPDKRAIKFKPYSAFKEKLND